MNIELHEIPVRELTAGYEDNDEAGVLGYGGKLDIRPPYQREFIYKDKQRNAVIDSLRKHFPLNVMYWAVLAHSVAMANFFSTFFLGISVWNSWKNFRLEDYYSLLSSIFLSPTTSLKRLAK